jgi:hypothetical protein
VPMDAQQRGNLLAVVRLPAGCQIQSMKPLPLRWGTAEYSRSMYDHQPETI